MKTRRQEYATKGKQRRDGEGNWNSENVCEGGGAWSRKKREVYVPCPAPQEARLSETAGKKEEKNGKARPEQVRVAERRTQKNKEKGNGGVFWPSLTAVRSSSVPQERDVS